MKMSILDEIAVSKREEVAAALEQRPLELIEAQAAAISPPQDFRAALAKPGAIRLIAEIKKASPSARVLRADFDPVTLAQTFRRMVPPA